MYKEIALHIVLCMWKIMCLEKSFFVWKDKLSKMVCYLNLQFNCTVLYALSFAWIYESMSMKEWRIKKMWYCQQYIDGRGVCLWIQIHVHVLCMHKHVHVSLKEYKKLMRQKFWWSVGPTYSMLKIFYVGNGNDFFNNYINYVFKFLSTVMHVHNKYLKSLTC